MSNSNQISKSFCVLPWVHLNVQPNGDIYPCCMAPYGKSIGNTTDNTLEEIWNGEKISLILNHKDGDHFNNELSNLLLMF